MELVATAIGLLGVALVVIAYALLSARKLSADHLAYPLLNLLGTIAIMVSLLYQWNLPSFVTQCIWIVISIGAIVRILCRRRA